MPVPTKGMLKEVAAKVTSKPACMTAANKKTPAKKAKRPKEAMKAATAPVAAAPVAAAVVAPVPASAPLRAYDDYPYDSGYFKNPASSPGGFFSGY